MKKDLVIKNFECGNEVKDITLSISPITFLVGPDSKVVDQVVNACDTRIHNEGTFQDHLDDLIGWFMDNNGYLMDDDEPLEFTNFWIKRLGIGETAYFSKRKYSSRSLLMIEKCGKQFPIYELSRQQFYLLGILLNIDFRKTMFNTKIFGFFDPEIHLYPADQSVLADIFYDAYLTYDMWFVIETQSEYLIRKSQVIVAEENYETIEELEEKCPFTTYYVPDQSTGELPYALGYRRDGLFKKSFGNGFYDEAYNLLTKIL
jgi:hypothetical protein